MEHRPHKTNIGLQPAGFGVDDKRVGKPAADVARGELFQKEHMGGPLNCSDLELSTYLQALEAGFLPTYYSDTSLSVRLKTISIASRSYLNGKKTVVFHGFPSLGMSAPSTAAHGEAVSTSFLADSRAKTSAPPGPEKGSPEPAVDCGESSPESSGRYAPDSPSSKIAPYSAPAASALSLKTWTAWGATRNGESYPRPMWVRPTFASECGLWPTPTVHGNHNRKGLSPSSGDGLSTAVKNWPTPTSSTGGPESDRCKSRQRGPKLVTAVEQCEAGGLPVTPQTKPPALNPRGSSG